MIRFIPIATETVRAWQAGAPDANGQPPERQIAQGGGNPCRHCLRMIPEGAPMLVLAHRPFATLQPYAELGPIFLCAAPCIAGGGAGGGADLPEMLASPDYIVRGYGPDERIVYGTGGVVPTAGIAARAEELLADPRVAFVHIRSARNNCFQCRVDRG
ncbi:DUF1203 domain-containing protein [Xinfangfangia pollutisoli]|uniref:DUF1203 domain-containing protein n=1 Tax=Xinfangfangia pollutisoli TaxID=2865960 RepID=UPI001CD3F8DB|nr:DUF1203 domain-containing protein [Xinfangfangia pollutisoli]